MNGLGCSLDVIFSSIVGVYLGFGYGGETLPMIELIDFCDTCH